MSIKESVFQTRLKNYLEPRTYVIKYNANGLGRTGVPDILFCYRGKFCAIECKREDGKLEMIQQYNINEIRKNEGYAWCIRADQFKDFVTSFEKEDWEKIGELSLENEIEIEIC